MFPHGTSTAAAFPAPSLRNALASAASKRAPSVSSSKGELQPWNQAPRNPRDFEITGGRYKPCVTHTEKLCVAKTVFQILKFTSLFGCARSSLFCISASSSCHALAGFRDFSLAPALSVFPVLSGTYSVFYQWCMDCERYNSDTSLVIPLQL